jgi:hypothetical protein
MKEVKYGLDRSGEEGWLIVKPWSCFSIRHVRRNDDEGITMLVFEVVGNNQAVWIVEAEARAATYYFSTGDEMRCFYEAPNSSSAYLAFTHLWRDGGEKIKCYNSKQEALNFRRSIHQ